MQRRSRDRASSLRRGVVQAKGQQFLVTAVSEAEQVLNDLQRSLSEQKELLAFSAQQQEMVLQRSLLSTQAISKTTVDFFNDLKAHACKLMKETDENHMERMHQLADFEETFKELSAKEEKAAIEKIVGILASLTAMRTNMVSSTVHRLSERCSQEANKLQLHMSSMQQASNNAKKEWISFVEKGESRYQEDISSSARLRNNMENVLHQCSEKVGQSMCHWAHTQLSIN
ncbi:kinesin-like protein KIN-5B [Ananas comosus]|uniref:Kinesin-like protein KIN-5B n=1 Tax=Ananas comosus TaxID=4615 RepID=A0A6P5FY14_ANACO|nr:kinesin-like protein KIN-5B [Ananas comosus]XP_020101256.1 kinesin-like protein KIN-5B [Ananas comosus]